MKDFYTTPNRDEYYRDHTISVDLVELHLKDTNNQTVFIALNSGGFDIDYTSPTKPAGAQGTYLGQGDFIGFSPLTEDFDVKVGKFTIYLSGVGTQSKAGNFITVNSPTVNYLMNYEIEGKRVVLYKAFLNFGPSGTAPLALAADPILMFDGVIYNYAIQEGSRSCQVTIDCSSLFADFERTNGRRTNSWSNWLFQGTKSDTAFEKSGFVGQTEYRWGRL